MLGQLLETLDDPRMTMNLIEALGEPVLLARLDAIAVAENRTPAEIVASAVRRFLDSSCDDHWLQLLGIMNRSEDPGLSAVRAILSKALPECAPSE